MLRSFPPAAAEDNNWLNDALIGMLMLIHEHVRRGETPPDWPAIIPAEHRARLSPRTALKRELQDYVSALRGLTDAEELRAWEVIKLQNNIAALVAGTCECADVTALPAAVREPLAAIFETSFRYLSDFEIRDRHYASIYNSGVRICPFCGCEPFDAPGAAREDYDHYLVRSIYPAAAANLRNLVPIGNKCNTRYKRSVDILRANGVRRRAFDPYSGATVVVSLRTSDLFDDSRIGPSVPRWRVEFSPDIEETTTWSTIFRIRERFVRDHLDPEYLGWVRLFQDWCRRSSIQAGAEPAEVLRAYTDFMAIENRDQPRGFLRTAVFDMLLRHCEADNQRLKELVKSWYQ